MLEDELLLIAGFENNRVLVKRSDTARQLHSADQIDRNVVPFLSCGVEKRILNVLLRRLGFHMPISFFAVDAAPLSLGRANWLQLSLSSAPTIRPCPELFNFPANNISRVAPGTRQP